MSEVEPPTGGDVVEGVPAEGAATEATEIVEPISEEPTYDYLDLDNAGNQHVQLTVDGEERTVTVQEALDGYNSNQAAQIRFQEAAQMREEANLGLQVMQAMEANPALTLQALAQQYGMDPSQLPGGQQAQPQAQPEPEIEYTDPLERDLAAARQENVALRGEFEQDRADRALRSAANGLKQTYNTDDETVRRVAGVAYQQGLGPEAFPMIYESMAYQNLQHRLSAHREQQQAAEAAKAGKVAAAASQSEIVSAGGGPSDVVANGTPSGNMSLAEAFDDAWNRS